MADDDILSLARDLGKVPEAAHRNIAKAIEFTAFEIKGDWQQGAEATGLEGYAASIDYTIEADSNGVSAEIGPNLEKRQGMFGLVEDGGDEVRSSPQHAGRDAMEANEPDFFRGLEIAIFDAIAEEIL